MADSAAQRAAFERAIAHVRERRTELAISELQSVLDTDPAEVNALRMLGSLYVAEGRPDDGIELLQQAVAHAPGFVHAAIDLARALASQERLPRAVQIMRQCCASEPRDSGAWQLLADLLFAGGDAPAARDAQQRSIAVDPFRGEVARAIEALNRGQPRDAEAVYRAILKRNPNHVHALVGLASVALDRDVTTDAERLLNHAYAQSPNFSHVLRGQARLHMKQSDYSKAESAALRAVELSPESAECWTSLGTVYAWGLNQEKAAEAFAKALAINPQQPRVHMSLGHVYKTLGDRDASVAAYRAAIEQDPNLGEAWWSLADLKTFAFSGEDINAMEALLDEPELERRERDRAAVCFALGKAFEDAGDCGRAFDRYAQGNAIRARHESFNTERYMHQIERAKRVYSKESVDRFADTPMPERTGPRPIFVIGLPRSGSTLVDQILSSHSAVQGTMELPHILGYVRELGHDLEARREKDDSAYPDCVLGMTREELLALGQRYLEETEPYHRGAPCFVDKMPNNFMHVGLISLMLPDAVFVDTRRHPLGCCFSIFKQNFARGQAFGYGLETLGVYYRGYVELMDHWRALIPERVYGVVYERMVENPDAEIRALLAFCGLPFEPECLNFHQTDRVVRTASAEQVRQPIYQSSKEQWRAFDNHLGPLRDALGSVLSDWGRAYS